jgi:anaerobic magnesium-protoporphyrin IX monomethyl ester cyclase
MKVLLINPWVEDVLPPPSIGYLQATLKHFNVDVVAKNFSDAMSDINNYYLVGVSFHSFSVRYARQIRDKFKCKLICGGHHPSALPEQMLSIGYDQVVVGEGENALIDIINGNNTQIITNAPNLFKTINDIPFPDYTGLNYSGNFGVNIITSRGCPFKCNFCASTKFWGHKYIMRSADNVLGEIEKRKSEGFNTWIFEDDNFTANKKRVYDICAELDGKLTWQCVGRAESMDEDLCHELYRAGCRRIYLGIESLSQASLDRCKKNTTVSKMIQGITTAENCGIRTFCLFLVGLPGDTFNDVHETGFLRKKINMSEYGTNIAWILPGTEIYDKAKEYGFDDNVYLESGAPYYTCEQSFETLNYWKSLI